MARTRLTGRVRPCPDSLSLLVAAMALLDATRPGADTGRAMAPPNVNVARGMYDEVARRDSVSPFDGYAEDIVQVQVRDDRRQPLTAVEARE
jgi:hypothetical protein